MKGKSILENQTSSTMLLVYTAVAYDLQLEIETRALASPTMDKVIYVVFSLLM